MEGIHGVSRRIARARIARHQPTSGNIAINLALLVMCAVCLLPVIWCISSSLKDRFELYQMLPTLFPKQPTLANYRWIFTQADMSRLPLNMFNSFKVTVGAIIVQCITASMAGFAFARLDFRARSAAPTLIAHVHSPGRGSACTS